MVVFGGFMDKKLVSDVFVYDTGIFVSVVIGFSITPLSIFVICGIGVCVLYRDVVEAV